MNWKKFKEEKPSEGEEVLAYHPSWIDEDFNPRGIRIGFWNGGDDFKSAHWWDYQDCYITISITGEIQLFGFQTRWFYPEW